MKSRHRSQTAYATDCFTCNNYQVLKHYQKLYKNKQAVDANCLAEYCTKLWSYGLTSSQNCTICYTNVSGEGCTLYTIVLIFEVVCPKKCKTGFIVYKCSFTTYYVALNLFFFILLLTPYQH